MKFLIILGLLLAQDKKTPDNPLQGPAAKCGTEIPWLTSMTDAIARAKATNAKSRSTKPAPRPKPRSRR